ncbi:transcription factor ICE1-like [Corylus avellana]|uniref:transcription factor ICE1-like n=1 Tax=Corylus avellana TaxID=13451 RepID=UPI00286AEDFB|nr:transcription factor ICE1-like [Corylus avellana]
MGEKNLGKRKFSSGDDVKEVSFYGLEESSGGGEQKGKQKAKAKHVLYERRRRNKFNEGLNLLKSVVPNTSKKSTCSVIEGAVEYMNDLQQRIDNLKNELESTSPGSSLMPTTRLHPSTPTPPTLPSHINDEVHPSSLPSPNGQAARVEIGVREGRAVQIHMCCEHKPGILVSTMRAMDNLGLDIQQGVISCSNGFAMDIYRAEQCKERLDVQPEQIRAELLNSTGIQEGK